MHNSLSLKTNRLSTKRKGSTMSLKDVLTAEEQESSRTTTEAAEEATVTDGKLEES